MNTTRRETEEERQQRLDQDRQRSQYAYDVAIKGFTRGAAYGLVGGLGASLLAQRYCKEFLDRRSPSQASLTIIMCSGFV